MTDLEQKAIKNEEIFYGNRQHTRWRLHRGLHRSSFDGHPRVELSEKENRDSPSETDLGFLPREASSGISPCVDPQLSPAQVEAIGNRSVE